MSGLTRGCSASVGVLAAVLSVTLLVSAAAARAGVSAPRVVSPRGLLVGEAAVAVAAGRTAALM
ncbi:MAG TPA: hypothetical protein VF526_19775, partial [Solirubrobacteraceae bacterium]